MNKNNPFPLKERNQLIAIRDIVCNYFYSTKNVGFFFPDNFVGKDNKNVVICLEDQKKIRVSQNCSDRESNLESTHL